MDTPFTPWFTELLTVAAAAATYAAVTPWDSPSKEVAKRPYLLLSALRGPDAEFGAYDPDGDDGDYASDKIKVLITCRIRAIVLAQRSYCSGLFRDTPITEAQVDVLEDVVDHKSGSSHYFSHLYRAVEASVGHPIWSGFEARIVEILRGY